MYSGPRYTDNGEAMAHNFRVEQAREAEHQRRCDQSPAYKRVYQRWQQTMTLMGRQQAQVASADDKDVAFRDASWYTDITVNRQIPVRGYISHRLCGKGQNKYIREVWVRPYVKSGYHRAASVKQ